MHARIDLADLSARQFALLFAIFFIIAAVPVLTVETLPLFDYPNHLARMHILADYDRAPLLRQFYALDWRPIPNLAMDLVVPPLSRLMPLAWAGKGFVLAIFLLIAGGTAALHRVLFGGWSAWSLLAFLLLYNRILLWGFVNFLFGVGLMLVATAAWVGLRERSALLRLPIATALAISLYFAHLFAFGTYALVILGYEIARLREQGRLRSPAGIGALCASGLQFVPVLAVIVLAAGPGGGADIGWSRPIRKLDILFNIVDNYHRWFDVATFALLVGLVIAGAARRALTVRRVMVLPLVLLCLAQLAMPNRLFGGTGVDHRMPVVLALLFVAASGIALRDRRRQAVLATLLVVLFVTRIGIVAATWIGYDRLYAPVVAALAALPPGSRLALASPPASVHVSGDGPPMIHLPALAVVTADAFVPTLFAFPGQQPLALREPYGALASAASPEDFWTLVAGGAAESRRRAAAALPGYDFVIATAEPPEKTGGDAALVLRARFANAALFAVRQ
jgi:hypothetical protein